MYVYSTSCVVQKNTTTTTSRVFVWENTTCYIRSTYYVWYRVVEHTQNVYLKLKNKMYDVYIYRRIWTLCCVYIQQYMCSCGCVHIIIYFFNFRYTFCVCVLLLCIIHSKYYIACCTLSHKNVSRIILWCTQHRERVTKRCFLKNSPEAFTYRDVCTSLLSRSYFIII